VVGLGISAPSTVPPTIPFSRLFATSPSKNSRPPHPNHPDHPPFQGVVKHQPKNYLRVVTKSPRNEGKDLHPFWISWLLLVPKRENHQTSRNAHEKLHLKTESTNQVLICSTDLE